MIVRALGGLLLIFLASGCSRGAGELPGDRTWSSTHFAYHMRSGETQACPDVLGPLEEHFDALQSYFGFAWQGGQRVSYYKFTDADDFRAHADCPPDAGGCAPGTTVESPTGLDLHELVHAYLYPSGFPPWIFVEGAAVALSCTARSYASDKPTLDWDRIASVQAYTDDAYSVGAWLVGYLLDVFGPRAFMTLYATIAHDASSSAIDAEFQSLYGQTLAAVWSAALREDQPRNTCVWQCSRASFALDGTSFDSSGVCGVTVARPFTLTAPRTIALSTTAADFSVGPCGANTPPETAVAGGHGAVGFYQLAAGNYFVEYDSVSGSITGQGDASAALNVACAGAVDPTLFAAKSAYVAVPGSSGPWYLRLPAPGGRKAMVVPFESAASGALCPTCDTSSCTSDSTLVGWTDPSVLMLMTDPSQSVSEFSVILQ